MEIQDLGSEPAVARGRPRDRTLSERVFTVVLEQLSVTGYPRLEIERVAANAGCAKSTIYRRWKTKQRLVAMAIASEHPGSTVVDTGNLVDDLIQHMKQGPSMLSFGGLAPVAWAAIMEPEIARILRDELLDARDAVADNYFTKSIRRGEIPADTDTRIILHTALGLGFYERFLANASLSEATLHQVLTAIIASPPKRAIP